MTKLVLGAGFSDAGVMRRGLLGPGVREAPRHEIAGGGALLARLALWRFEPSSSVEREARCRLYGPELSDAAAATPCEMILARCFKRPYRLNICHVASWIDAGGAPATSIGSCAVRKPRHDVSSLIITGVG